MAVQGVVLGDGTSFTASSGANPSSAQAQKITVTVAGTTITAEVAANGTFELKGIPSGSFTLVFLVDGVKIGEVLISAREGSEVKVVVQVKDVRPRRRRDQGGDGADSRQPNPSPAPRPRAWSTAARWARASSSKATFSSVTPAGFQLAVNGRAARPWT